MKRRMMFVFFTVLVVSMLVAAVASAASLLTNPGFETGDLTGWTASNFEPSATTSHAGYSAPHGSYFAVVPGGCYTNSLSQSFDATAGDTISGWAYFNAGDYLPYNDQGLVNIVVSGGGGVIDTLLQVNVADVGNYGGTPWIPWTHTFAADGTYTIQAISTNAFDCGFTSYVGLDLVINEGFVTGGGWINSPEGAFKADTTLTGKANFGFNAKYKKGANVPDGNTQFQFQTADLNFHSTSYDWLVVSGQDKAKFKGSGTVNGEGDYSFMLTVQDNGKSGDTFRIKIVENGGGVVYDNQNTGDETYDGTELGGGSIVIHANK